MHNKLFFVAFIILRLHQNGEKEVLLPLISL